ncbi:tryptase-like [Centruroides vittatus]|uniref:tryptase-like n=1 Tax=Centruroides vittatus TaxID=120091 RepID=UPI00351022DF
MQKIIEINQMALFLNRNSSNVNITFIGTFTLITTRTALGAAHVTNSHASESLVGSVGHADKFSGQRIYFSNKIEHPNYTEESCHNDIALLIIRDDTSEFGKFKLPLNVQPIALPRDNKTYTLERASMVGWGRIGRDIKDRTPFLRAAYVNIIDTTENDKLMCQSVIVAREEGVSLMYGDSGGPLIYEANDGRKIQIGVASTSQLRPGGINNFVSTSYFIEFITENCVGKLTFV